MKRIKLIIIYIIIFSCNTLIAHPHLFAGVDIDFDATKLDTLIITERWMFDDLTSMIILEDFDSNGDDEIDAKELESLKKLVIPGLLECGFYTDLEINDKKVIITEISNFSVGVEDIFVYYKFDLKVPILISDTEQTIKINVYDREFYTKFFINADSGIKIVESEELKHDISVYENEAKSYYFGQLSPLEVKLKIWKEQ